MSSNITLRIPKGVKLTYNEGDNNFRDILKLFRFTEDMPIVGGTADAIELTSSTYPVESIANGMWIAFVAAAPNSVTAPTLDVDGTGPIVMERFDGSPMEIADLITGQFYVVRYNGATNTYRVIIGIGGGGEVQDLQSVIDEGSVGELPPGGFLSLGSTPVSGENPSFLSITEGFSSLETSYDFGVTDTAAGIINEISGSIPTQNTGVFDYTLPEPTPLYTGLRTVPGAIYVYDGGVELFNLLTSGSQTAFKNGGSTLRTTDTLSPDPDLVLTTAGTGFPMYKVIGRLIVGAGDGITLDINSAEDPVNAIADMALTFYPSATPTAPTFSTTDSSSPTNFTEDGILYIDGIFQPGSPGETLAVLWAATTGGGASSVMGNRSYIEMSYLGEAPPL